jgi:hypothetical protein
MSFRSDIKADRPCKCKGTSQCLARTALQPHMLATRRLERDGASVLALIDPHLVLRCWSQATQRCLFLELEEFAWRLEEDRFVKGMEQIPFESFGLVRMLEDPVPTPYRALCTDVAFQ